ncbi:MAG TPA: TlpA disulfide reductase family protein [Planctomycetota bacterium]|nr:TlpA disulfide reductase family protein [Planctomycetota bacterium]
MKLSSVAVAATFVFTLVCASALCVEEPPKTPDAPKDDQYKLPDNPTVKSLVAFCKKLEGKEPQSQAEADEMQTKVKPALKKACEQILALEKGNPTDDSRYANRFLLIFKLQEVMEKGGENPTPEAKKELLAATDELKKFLSDPKFTLEDVALAVQLGDLISEVDEAKAVDYFKTFAKLYENNADPKVAEAGKRMAATSRRLGLVGNEMVLKGTTVEGKPFDISSLKGKVVLVDFWATWCHWCVKEIPNVKKNYLGYHNKGFEVVAVSADQDRAALDEFLGKSKIPWINLHDKDGENAALEYYGITGFPTTFLIGKDGKVVSLKARGPELDKQLKDILGEPDAIKDLPEAPAEKENPLNATIKEAIKEEK